MDGDIDMFIQAKLRGQKSGKGEASRCRGARRGERLL